MKIDRFISVIAPLHNDSEIIDDFIQETLEVLSLNYTNYELVLVDDGSTDDTVKKISSLLNKCEGIRLLPLSREFGEEIAITAGLDSIIGDFSVVMLPHMDPPSLIPELVNRCISGIDVVYGVRESRVNESWLRRKITSFFFWYCHKILNIELSENATQFRCMSRQAVNAIIQIRDTYRYLRLFSSFVGYQRKAYVYEPIQRGQSKQRSFSQAVNLALSIIMENSPHPLRFVSWIGLATAASNLTYIVYIVLIYLFKEDVLQGWTTLSLQNAAQFFFIALILTALCEYTGRVLNRLQNRPLYYLNDEKNSSVLLVDTERKNIVESSASIEI